MPQALEVSHLLSQRLIVDECQPEEINGADDKTYTLHPEFLSVAMLLATLGYLHFLVLHINISAAGALTGSHTNPLEMINKYWLHLQSLLERADQIPGKIDPNFMQFGAELSAIMGLSIFTAGAVFFLHQVIETKDRKELPQAEDPRPTV